MDPRIEQAQRMTDATMDRNAELAGELERANKELASLRARLEAAERKAREWQSAAHAAGERADAAERERDEARQVIDWSMREYLDDHDAVEAEIAKSGRDVPDICYAMAKMRGALKTANANTRRRGEQRDAALRELEALREERIAKRVEAWNSASDWIARNPSGSTTRWTDARAARFAQERCGAIESQRDAATALLRDLAPYLKSGDMMPADLFRRLAEYASPSPLASPEGDEAGRECAVRITCDSCGGDFLSRSKDDATCPGCDAVICQSCDDVFDHSKDGSHDKGDPAEVSRVNREVVSLLEQTAEMNGEAFWNALRRLPVSKFVGPLRSLTDAERAQGGDDA